VGKNAINNFCTCLGYYDIIKCPNTQSKDILDISDWGLSSVYTSDLALQRIAIVGSDIASTSDLKLMCIF
jgi:hypothetical protein